ncbi:MAG: fused MFS/spermidine synthase [Bifidobacteriaceae bacterium]|jgi:spermidine synthase|nr:fused MFS/spermidine synthase [Bifidobacteriaceae bacterium]MCI1914443.1 fused MFS/spermidine synthase [Bifidobacteriaceae bacterium]
MTTVSPNAAQSHESAASVTAHTRPLLKNRLYLYATEFFAGMAVMAAELGASRLLAPYFSSSQIVWTIIIGTIMIAMALGNVWGGRRADKDPNPDKLYMRILIAAVWIALIPLVGKYVILGISGALIVTVSTNFLIIAAFASCMIIFVPPLFLLGTVTPSLAKFTMDSLDDNASVVGRLGAANTIGSILGTFLPTFVTIPAVGTFVTFLIFSGILLVLPLVYFIAARIRLIASVISVIVFAGSAAVSPLTGFAFWEKNVAFEGESVYNYLQVKSLSDRTILSTNVLFGVQSVAMKQGGLTGLYYDTALAAPALATSAKSALILGMGTGTYARQLRQYYPKMKITGVEIDDKITSLADQYFDEPADIPVSTYDGRAWLAAAGNAHYDVIMVDAYQDITIPFQMSSQEFFSLVRSHLNPGGVMVVNMNMHSDGKGSINEALEATIAHTFSDSQVATADVEGTTNRELFVKKSGTITGALNSASETAYARTGSYELSSVMSTVAAVATTANAADFDPSLVLTDDHAPVEVLGMKAIDALIADEATPYRDTLRAKGIQGLLDMA